MGPGHVGLHGDQQRQRRTPRREVTDDTGRHCRCSRSGDKNGDGKLDLTETWIFKATGTAIAGTTTTSASAEGYGPANDKVSDTDPSSYFGSDAKIGIEKVTNGSDGPYIHLGDPVTWTYTVSNTGNVPSPT